MDLDISRILRVLPHRAPFLLLDEVLELQPRSSARAVKRVSKDEPYLRGHFPTAPIFPAVLTLEAMAQLMTVLAYASDALDPNQQTFRFAGIDRAKFSHPIGPSDNVFIEMRVLQLRSNTWKCAGTASVGNVSCAEAELCASIQDREGAPAGPLLMSTDVINV